jgi:hypothetical protein
MRFREVELVAVGSIAVALGLYANDWMPPACVLALWLGIKLVSTHDSLFVLPIALTFHWSQTSLGVFYNLLTGRSVPANDLPNINTMVLIGLGCVLAMAAGIYIALRFIQAPDATQARPGFAFSLKLLVIVYVASIFLEGVLGAAAPEYPTLRQIITTFESARLGILFLILRRLCNPTPRWLIIGAVVAVEVVLGITGFFAGFREPFVLAILAVLEVFDRRNARHWFAIGTAGVAMVALALIWMAIRTEYRAEYVDVDQFAASRQARVDRVQSLTSNFVGSDAGAIWKTADDVVDRMWTVYYPALAIARVPQSLPHTDGAICGAAMLHIVTPRLLFPDKPNLPSSSDEVRKYSNVMVAGAETNTSIAFGYAAESYIDFGIPMMFLPVFAYGLFIGVAYALYRKFIWHRELFVSFATVSFWISMYLFERGFATIWGVSLGFMVYLGVPILMLDRFLMVRYPKQSNVNRTLAFAPLERHEA